MLYRVRNPSILSAIPEAILPLVYLDPAGPILVGVEKSAIHFDPADTPPETATAWEAVADSIGENLGALVAARLREGEVARFIDGGVWWRHLTVTAALLVESGIHLRVQPGYSGGAMTHDDGLLPPPPLGRFIEPVVA